MLTQSEKVRFLRNVKVFGYVPDNALESIARIAHEADHPADYVLFEQGEIGNIVYFIIEGEVCLIRDGTAIKTIDVTDPCIGEMALITGDPRTATIKTTGPSKLLAIKKEEFLPILSENPGLARGIFHHLNDRLRSDLDTHARTMREQLAREESLRMAALVQRGLLPVKEIDLPWCTTAGFWQPAGSVGGDYYDYLPLAGDRLAIFIGDAIGHGLHSAILMAMTRSALRTQVEYDASPAAVLKAINRVMEQQLDTGLYLTCCYTVIDLNGRFLSYVNAGHLPILRTTADGDVRNLESNCAPPGLWPTSALPAIPEQRVAWNPGDALIIYSDGVTDVSNRAGEMYGEERLMKFVSTAPDGTAAQVRDAILTDVTSFRNGAKPEDDITLVVVKFRESRGPRNTG